MQLLSAAAQRLNFVWSCLGIRCPTCTGDLHTELFTYQCLTYLHPAGSVLEEPCSIPLLAVTDHGQFGDLAQLLGRRVVAVAVVAVVAVRVSIHGEGWQRREVLVRIAALHLDNDLLLQSQGRC